MIGKRDGLHTTMDSWDADIVALTETWLSAKVANSELFQGQKTFNAYRNDRESRSRGGVLIAVASSIDSSILDLETELEFIPVCVTINFLKFILGCCYRPPSPNTTFVNNLCDAINIHVCFPNLPFVLWGDFNYPNMVRWFHAPLCKPIVT